VLLTWYSAADAGLLATVYRRTANTDWTSLGQVTPDGTGYLRFTDNAVQGGMRYGYGLDSWTVAQKYLPVRFGVSAEAPALAHEAVLRTLREVGI
jgi:hypothetical protein